MLKSISSTSERARAAPRTIRQGFASLANRDFPWFPIVFYLRNCAGERLKGIFAFFSDLDLAVTFGVFGVIPSYLVIILLKIYAFGKYKHFDVKHIFSTKNLETSIKIPILGSEF